MGDAAPRDPDSTATLGPYEIISEIGRGGMGVVYKAFHPGLKRTVALKVLIAGEDASEEAITRFHREAEAVAKLGHHPNIVPIYDIGQVTRETAVGAQHAAPLHYFAMHYVDGVSLDRLIDDGKITPREAALIAMKLARALAHAHSHGILHRDVKPANVLMAGQGAEGAMGDGTMGDGGREGEIPTPSTGSGLALSERNESNGPNPKSQIPNPSEEPGIQETPVRAVYRRRPPADSGSNLQSKISNPDLEPLLTDFGLAKDIRSETKMTRSGMTLGTPQYMPPEQAKGDLASVDERSDVYSLGATLYEMLALRSPFEGDNVMEVVQKVLLKEPVSPRRCNPVLDRDLETICMKCLEKEPSRRFGSAHELVEDLGRYLAGEQILARPAGPGYRLLKLVRRHKGLFTAALIFLAILFAGLVAARHVIQRGSMETEKEREKAELADQKRKEAECKEAEATRRKEKNSKVSAVLLMAYAKLGDMHRELKASYFSGLLSDEAKRARFEKHEDRLREFCEATAPDPASRATMLAVKGWLYRLARREDEALALFREARETDPEVAWGYLFEAMSCLSRYIVEQPWPRYIPTLTGMILGKMPEESKGLRNARQRFEALVRPAGAIREGGTSKGGGSMVMGEETETFSDVYSGFRGMYEGDFERAGRGLSLALNHWATAWLEEEVLLARTKIRYLIEDFQGGIEDARRFLERCPENLSVGMYLATLHHAQSEQLEMRGEDPKPALRKSIETCTEILRRNPGHCGALVNRGVSAKDLANAEGAAGRDPREILRGAIRDLTEALRLSPGLIQALNGRGNAYQRLGEAEVVRGGDGKTWFRRALQDLDECVRREPEDTLYANNRGIALDRLAQEISKDGGDPEPLYLKAIADYGKMIEGIPEHIEALNNRGHAYLSLGLARRNRGLDPMESFLEGAHDFDRMVDLAPEYGRGYCSRAMIRVRMAEALEALGKDRRDLVHGALADCREALKLNWNPQQVFGIQGDAYRMLAESRLKLKLDPRDAFRSSIQSFGEALRINPNDAGFRSSRANVLRIYGNLLAAMKEDPREAYRQAVADCERALELNPELISAYTNLGLAYRGLADEEQKRKGNAVPLYEKALAAYEETLKRNPDYWRGHANKGLIFEILGRHDEAVSEYETALGIVKDNVPLIKQFLARAKRNAESRKKAQ